MVNSRHDLPETSVDQAGMAARKWSTSGMRASACVRYHSRVLLKGRVDVGGAAFEIFRLLRLIGTGDGSRSLNRELRAVELDAPTTLSFIAEAASNVNCMLLEHFLHEIGFARRLEFARAVRIVTGFGTLAVLSIAFEDAKAQCRLVHAEFGRARLSGVFLDDDVAFVRDARVFVSPFIGLDEARLSGTSLHVSGHFRTRGPDHRTLPPVA